MSVNTLATVRDGFFDTHAHYNDPRMRETFGDVDAWIKHLLDENVAYILNAATDLQTAAECLSLAEKFAPLYAAVGIHPSDAGAQKQSMQEVLSCVRQLLAHPKAVAVGEIGLDYHYDDTPRDLQREWFDAQLSLSVAQNMPVVIHDREAHGDMMDMLWAHKDVRGVMHSYSGSVEMAKVLLRRDFYISFSGVVTFKNAAKLLDAVRYVPLSRMLIETDCPYLSPVPMRGKCNHSGYLSYTAAAIAQIKQTDVQTVMQITKENAFQCFGITPSND